MYPCHQIPPCAQSEESGHIKVVLSPEHCCEIQRHRNSPSLFPSNKDSIRVNVLELDVYWSAFLSHCSKRTAVSAGWDLASKWSLVIKRHYGYCILTIELLCPTEICSPDDLIVQLMYEIMLVHIFIEHSDPTFTIIMGKSMETYRNIYPPVALWYMN